MGRRTAATEVSAPAGGWSSQDAPPISLLSCQKRNGPCTVQREKRLMRSGAVALRATGVGVSVQAPIWPDLRARYSLLRFLWCRPVADGAEVVGVVVVLPLLLFSLPLAVPCGNVSGSGKRSRMYPCTSPGQRVPQGQCVSVPDFYKGVPAFPRRRQEVCACADRPAEHFFFSTGRGAFSF